MRLILFLFTFKLLLSPIYVQGNQTENKTRLEFNWKTLEATGSPIARHEAGLVAIDKKIYLMGGRKLNPTSVFDTETMSWANGSPPPLEMHHFQPVVFEGKIYVVAALTGQWPNEKPIESVIIYDPKTDTYVLGDPIPKHRQRGGAGAVVYNNKIYIVGGIVNGHMDGYQSWFDEYNPATGNWKTLKNAPQARDHFQAAIVNNKLHAFGGRTTSKRSNQDMSLTVAHGDIYDFENEQWLQTTTANAIPTPRAGNGVFTWNNQLIVGGGESVVQVSAHSEIESFNTVNQSWTKWPSLNHGRHGTGFAVVDGYAYTASGSGNRGGEPELYTLERLQLPTPPMEIESAKPISSVPVYKQWHTVTLGFEGPHVKEMDTINPFLHFKLQVDFTHLESGQSITVPGYYAADGKAANTGASEGNVWEVKFNPPQIGKWRYSARMYQGENIAIETRLVDAKKYPLQNASGLVQIIPSDSQGKDFKSHGRIVAQNGYFKFEGTNKYWLKGGTNSPENLLGYVDFDNTYKVVAQAREGEAAPSESLHNYKNHLKDWLTGDPQWKSNQGRSLIGSINYLAAQNMNSVYFLTMNILGDGKDVWPYLTHEDLTRFDVSKLAQWELVFEHMQSKGILLHLVIQETENELLLDNGDTGPLRKLYLNELIARFGHHLGLVWNLGEENGYAKWTPNAQNTAQRKAMASYIRKNDVFSHPILLHTHAHDPDRENILNPLLGFSDIDGLSLQVDKREQVNQVIREWSNASEKMGHKWIITMDEIGMWHTGAMPDSLDKHHSSLQQHALWGALLAGAAGVEWYFGAKYPHNDLTSEDWRERENLWKLTKIAKQFFEDHIPFWQNTECSLPKSDTLDLYCAKYSDDLIVLYLPDIKSGNIRSLIENPKEEYSLYWFDPVSGGALLSGSKATTTISVDKDFGEPPYSVEQHWVLVLKSKKSL